MASHDRLTLDGVLAGFDEHLRRTRGVCAGTRRNYARFVRVFLQRVFVGGPVDVAKIHPRDVVEFVGNLTIPSRRPAPRLPTRPLIMCSHIAVDHRAARGPPPELHITLGWA